MLLRDHPLVSYKDIRNWPPPWIWVSGGETKRPIGELGVLRRVELSKIEPPDRCFLHVDHEGSSYIACLMFDDAAFCIQIAKLLTDYCNLPIAEIGSIDLSYTL